MSSGERIYVFYAGLLHSTHNVFPKLDCLGAEVYNGCFVWVARPWLPMSIFEPVGWYRGDATRYPEELVPKELRVQALLLT